MSFAGLTCSSSGCVSASPGFFPSAEDAESQCWGTAVAGQQQGAEGSPWFARQSYRGNVQWHYQKAPLLWSEIESVITVWSNCICQFSDNDLHRAVGWFSHTLCAGMGKGHWEPTLKITPLLSQLWVKQILDWFESWCVWLNNWTIWESDVSTHPLIWEFGCLRGSLRLWEQREGWTGIPELAGLLSLLGWVSHPGYWAELLCCRSPLFITLLSKAVLLEQKGS